MDFTTVLLDEIALEGLDGITIDGLWLRLSKREDFLLSAVNEDEKIKIFVWNIVRHLRQVDFYELEEPRLPLSTYNYYITDSELGIVTEVDPLPTELYPHYVINDTKNNIVGSCSTYYSRKNVSPVARKLSYENVLIEYGRKLVIVASQEIRKKTLINHSLNPNLEFSPLQYCILERVARSRYIGESTQGKFGLNVLGESKTIFYLRKLLLKHNLIRKQFFHKVVNGTNLSGLLLHLPRFYVIMKPKYVTVTENIIRMLKDNPSGMIQYNTLRDSLSVPGILGKLSKMPLFQKVIQTDLKLPYRTVHPDATVKQWKQKSSDKEKTLRLVKLRNPDMDVRNTLNILAEDSDDEEDESVCKPSGVLDERNRFIDCPMLTQGTIFLKKAGSVGLSQTEFGAMLGLTKLLSRTVLRNLVKTGVVGFYMADIGRQRISKYYLKSCDNGGEKLIDKDEVAKFSNAKVISRSTCNLTNLNGLVSGDANHSIEVKLINENQFKNLNASRELSQMCSDFDESRLSGGKEEIFNISQPSTSSSDFLVQCNHSDENRSIKRKHGLSDEECFQIKTPKLTEIKEDATDIFSVLTNNNVSLEAITKDAIENSNNICTDKFNSNEKVIEVSEKISTVTEIDNTVDRESQDTTNHLNVDDENTCNKNNEYIKLEHLNIEYRIIEDLDWLRPKGHSFKELDKLKSGLPMTKKNFTTYRLLKRSNIILEAVHELKVCSDFRRLIALIKDSESNECSSESRKGRNRKDIIDKKSFMRLMYRLAINKNILIYRAEMKNIGENHLTYINYACDVDVKTDHPLIISAIELIKLKPSIPCHAVLKPRVHSRNQYSYLSLDKFKNLQLPENTSAAVNKESGSGVRKGDQGHYPKFNRMKLLHKLLYYLVYSYEGSDNLDQDEAKAQINKEFELTQDVTDDLSTIYVPRTDWKMFIPPLPINRSEDQGSGWCILSDILLRLPLSFFMQLSTIRYFIPELDSFMNHPVKKHVLVIHLPDKIRKYLTYGRKYIFSIFEDIERLVCIGLIQLGPQITKDKDQVFVYVNKNAKLLDTTLSKPGYHNISTDVVYPEMCYKFTSLNVVIEYWHDMWKICMGTRLGSRKFALGTDVILENVFDKKEIVEALRPHNFLEAYSNDNGSVPGDKLGAAGFDSALFAHLKRNWFYRKGTSSLSTSDSHHIINKKPNVTNKRKRNVSVSVVSSHGAKSVMVATTVKRDNRKNFNSIFNLSKQSKVIRRRSLKVRHVIPVKKSFQRKPYYDQVDKEALSRMSKLRVDWSQKEDRMLLLCKIAMVFLCPDTRKHVNTNIFFTIREILHKLLPESKNKTSRACQRRVTYMLRNKNTCYNINLCVEELKHDEFIVKKYGNAMEIIQNEVFNKGKKITDMEIFWKCKFKELSEYLIEHYSTNDNFNFLTGGLKSNVTIPNTVTQFYKEFNVIQVNEKNNFKSRKTFKPVNCIQDIYCATINGLIHSNLCCNLDTNLSSWSYHLFSIYQQYPDKLLRIVVNKLRENQIVSFKKNCQKVHLRSDTYLPLTTSPYQLSVIYLHQIQTKYQFDIYAGCYETLTKLIVHEFNNLNNEKDRGCNIISLDGGATATLIQLLSTGMITFHIDIPNQLIILDPYVNTKDETYTRLVQRYNDILSHYKKYMVTSSVLFQKDDYACTSKMIKNCDSDTKSNDIDSENCYSDNNKLIKNVSGKENLDETGTTDFSSYQNTVMKAASRIALYVMRDDVDTITQMEPKEMDHVHDFFVVNSCIIYAKIKNIKEPLTNKSEQNFNTSFCNSINIISDEQVHCILDGIESTSIFPDNPLLLSSSSNKTIDDLINENFIDKDNNLVKLIVEEIEIKKELGLTNQEVVNTFGKSITVCNVLDKLVKLQVLLRTGVVCTRYVHFKHVRPWLLHSYRSITRTSPEAAVQNGNDDSSLLDENNETVNDDHSNNVEVGESDVSINNDEDIFAANEELFINDLLETSKSVISNEASTSKNIEKCDVKGDYGYNTKVDNYKMTCPIKVVIRPWIRVDGTINRKVLDSWLTSVLGHIMLNPGISLFNVQQRFTPILQPRHVTELCDILKRLNCINYYSVKIIGKSTLFSKPTKVVLCSCIGLEDERNIRIEVDKLAIINLGKLISKRPYKSDLVRRLMGK